MICVHFFCLLYLLSKFTCVSSQSTNCLAWQKKHLYLEKNYTILYDFDSFSELENDCVNINISSPVVEFLPKYANKLILNKSLNIKHLIDTLIEKKRLEACIVLDFKGVHLSFLDTKINNQKLLAPKLIMSFSTIDFYVGRNGKSLKPCECNSAYFNRSNDFLFTWFYVIEFVSIKYPQFMCPLVFKSFFLSEISFGGISNSFLSKNRLNFIEIEKDNALFFKRVLNCQFELKYEVFSTRIMNKYLFKNVNSLVLSGIVNGIEVDMFKHFKFISQVIFFLDNLRAFFHQQCDNKWMIHLNANVNVNLTNLKDYTSKIASGQALFLRFDPNTRLSSFNQPYKYPNKDFCLFMHFPHQNLVIPHLVFKETFDCSCTIKYLVQYNWIHFREKQVSAESDAYLFDYVYVNDTSEHEEHCFTHAHNFSSAPKCDFNHMLKHCHLTNFTSNRDFFTLNSDPEILYFIKWFQLLFSVILQPLFCFIGIINNLTVIIVVKSRLNKKLFKEKMYSFIALNSAFSIAYCVIMILKMMNECIFFSSTLFCSSIYRSNFVQYFKILVVHFLGNVCKVSMNLAYILFALSRLILASHKTNFFFSRFNRISVKWLVLTLFVSSVLLSVYKLFQYKPNRTHLPYKEFPYERNDEMECKMRGNDFECRLFNALKVLNSSLNDIVIFLLNILIDVCLYRRFRDHLEDKIRVKGHFLTSEHHDELKSKQTRLNKMIVLNGIVYFIGHFPEFLTTLLLIIFSKKISNFCFYQFSCDLFNENASFFNVFSISFQFLLFLCFDQNFHTGFLELLRRFFKI